jgi:hypothetical protein
MGGVGSIKTLCVIRPAQCLVTSPTNTQRNVHPPAHGQARLRGRKCNASGFPGSGASAVIFPQPSWLSQGSAMNYVTLALSQIYIVLMYIMCVGFVHVYICVLFNAVNLSCFHWLMGRVV